MNRVLSAVLLAVGLSVAVRAEGEGPRLCVYNAASGVTDLTSSDAWTDGSVPGADDIAVFDGDVPVELTLGAATEWAGLVRTNAVDVLTLVAPADGTLTLGASGLLIHGANGDFKRLYLSVPDILLSAAQTWTWSDNKSPFVRGRLSGADLTLDCSGKSLGNAIFGGPVSVRIAALRNVDVFTLENGTWETPPVMPGWNVHYLVPGMTATNVTFAELFPNRSVSLATGILSFGAPDGNTAFSSLTNTITLSAGDALKGPSGEENSRGKGVIRVQDAHLVQNGADVTDNVWMHLRSGTFEQTAGQTAFRYAVNIGRGSAGDYGLKEQKLLLDGGTFASRRLVVGMGNHDTVPAEFRVTGGSYGSTFPDANSASYWAAGLTIAARTMSGETMKDAGGQDVVFSSGAFPAGRVEISGGTVKTPAVIFGNNYNVYQYDEKTAGARFALAGGELQVGPGGLMTGVAWNPDTSRDASWYDAVLSGGTLSFYGGSTVSPADLRLSAKDGGVTFNLPAGGVTLGGSVCGAVGFRKTGGGELHLTGANDFTGRIDVVEGRVAVGAERPELAIWTADDLAARGDGASAANWSNTLFDTKWAISHTTSIPGTSGTTPPSVKLNDFGEHASVAFNGQQSAFLTGNVAQPISGKEEFTVALVLKTEPGFTGNDSARVEEATQFFGTSMQGTGSDREYGLAIDAQGRIGCGMFAGTWQDATTKTNCTMESEYLWATDVPVNDGQPHLVIWSWKFGDRHILQIDGTVVQLASPENGVRYTRRTRIVFGVGERQTVGKRFKGAIADLRMCQRRISQAERQRLAQELGETYGIAAFPAVEKWRVPTALARADVPVPAAEWSADALAQTAGQPVEAWAEKDGRGAPGKGAWTFTRSLADVILRDGHSGYAETTTAPVIAADTVRGHKLVSFNGRSDCLALTGGSPTPTGYSSIGATIAMAVRFTGYGTGGGALTAAGTAQFLGTGYGADQGKENWGFSLSAAARAVFFHQKGVNAAECLRSRRRFLDDGEMHILVAVIPAKNDPDGRFAFYIDGNRYATESGTSVNVINTRIMLGGGEVGWKSHYAPVDVAEFALWKDVALTEDQVRTLSTDLAEKYGVYLDGYERGIAIGRQQRAAEIFVHAGANYGGSGGGYGFTLYPGQTLWGDGLVQGRMTMAPGAALMATPTNTLSCSSDVEMLDGAVLAACFTGGAAVKPVTVNGGLTLPDGTVTVRLNASEGALPTGTLLTWTGDLRKRGATVFAVEGVSASSVKVGLDETNKRIVVVSACASLIVIR